MRFCIATGAANPSAFSPQLGLLSTFYSQNVGQQMAFVIEELQDGCRRLPLKQMLVFMAAMPLATLSGCSQFPRVDVQPRVENQRIVFDVPYSGINGILGFRVEDESGNPLWVIDTAYEKGRKIVYGELPTGGNMEAKQEFPLDNQPPAEIRGKTVTVKVTYQYDRNISACSDTYSKKIQVPE